MGKNEMATPEKEIVLNLGDLLQRVPPEYLNPGPHDLKRQLRIKMSELAGEMSSGRTTMPLSRLSRFCPEVFKSEPQGAADIDVLFPWQKVFGQLPAGIRPGEMRPAENRYSIPVHAEIFPPRRPSLSPNRTPLPVVPAENGGLDIVTRGEIHLSLASILGGLSPELRQNVTRPVPDDLRVTLPLELIEPQLASGRVYIPLQQLVTALPEDFKGFFPANDTRPVPLPLTEIFQSLPDQATIERSKTVREQMVSLQMAKTSRETAARGSRRVPW